MTVLENTTPNTPAPEALEHWSTGKLTASADPEKSVWLYWQTTNVFKNEEHFNRQLNA